MTERYPMLPPAADGLDSFSPLPAIGQRESQTLTSESPKPFEPLELASNVIRFDFNSPRKAARKAYARALRTAKPKAEAMRPETPSSVTAGNSRLRKERQETWRMAEAATRYWRVRLDFESAVDWAQRMGTPEGESHPVVDPGDWRPMVGKYRAALVRQLLTPAFDANSVKWKEATFAKGQHKHTDINPKKIEKAIADDLAWLLAHPTRRTGNSEACAKRRAFKEAMRQRVREIAASRNLSDEEIRPVLKLKHEEVGRFCKAHGVNIGWLLEGIGPMFKVWPTS
jgi:hypothetical protein